MSSLEITWLSRFLLNRYIMWQAGFPQGDMQHVNVCRQALCKRLRKSCREQEKEEEEGARKWEAKHWKSEPASPWAQCDRRQQGGAVTACLHLHNQQASSSPSSFLRASGRGAQCLLSGTIPHSQSVLPQLGAHWSTKSRASGMVEWAKAGGLWSWALMALLLPKPTSTHYSAFLPSHQTRPSETCQQQGILSWVVSHLSSIMTWSCPKMGEPVNGGQAVPEACHCAVCISIISLETHCSPSDPKHHVQRHYICLK